MKKYFNWLFDKNIKSDLDNIDTTKNFTINNQEWISIDHTHPDKDEVVLASIEINGRVWSINTVKWDNEKKSWFIDDNIPSPIHYSHWTRSPEIPENLKVILKKYGNDSRV